MILGLAVLGAAVANAAPVMKAEPVAEGYPSWIGAVPKNYITGREICASDLRHKITIVLEVDATDEKLQSQFIMAGKVAALNPLAGSHFGDNWETRVLPRDIIFVISVRGGGKNPAELVLAAMKPPKDADENVSRMIANIRNLSVPVYSDLTYEGATDSTGKRPYVYVMGPTGAKPLYEGTLTAKADQAVKAAYGKAKKQMSADGFKWDPFVGSIAELKNPLLLKALEKGKTAKTSPLAPVLKAIQKDIVSKDPEKAKEAQILYDALEQTRSDLVMRIKMECRECPHRAVYDVQQLLKYWPGEKKRLEAVAAKLKENPEANKLAQIYCKIMVWADSEFTPKNAGEAKKIVGELNKMKKDIEKLKESKTIVVQNGALLMDSQIDDLISAIPTRVPEK